METKEQTYIQLKEDIIYDQYSPGERLIEKHIVDELKSSRLYVREAIRRLHDEGLVEMIPNKGASVKKISLEEAVNCYGIIGELEAYAAELAILNFSDANLDELQEINNLMNKHVTKNKFMSYVKENLKFHLFLARMSNNNVLLNLISNLRNRVLKYSYSLFLIPENVHEAIKQHQDIISACNSKDTNNLKEQIKNHVETVKEKIIKSYERRYC